MSDDVAKRAWVERVLGFTFTAAAAPRGVVGFAKLLLRWRAAQAGAAENLAALGTGILALGEVRQDPRLAQVQKAAAMLPTLVPRFGETLADQLDAATNAGATPKGQAALRAALTTIAGYRAQLAAVPALAALEQFAGRAVGKTLPILAALTEVLAELEAEIAARAG